MNLNINLDRYESINKRDFKSALTNLLENEYKILGSRKILSMLADDIDELYKECNPSQTGVQFGEIVFRTTKDNGQRQSYGKKAEDYDSTTVILPLITKEDIETMVRLIKSAKKQGGLLTGAEVSVLMNRSLSSLRKYLDAYRDKTGEILPFKCYVLDQGSLPTHKGIIISLYEQGVSPADIVLKTSHSQSAIDRYIAQYDQIKRMILMGLKEVEIVNISRRSLKLVRGYVKLYYDLNPVKECQKTLPH